VRVARQEGTNAWLYDEDRWPSGAAGGLVPARGGDAYRAKVVTVEESDTLPEWDDDTLAIFIALLHDGAIVHARRVTPDTASALRDGETFLVFRREVSGPTEWFNDDAYADNMNPDAVAAFLDITYEAYRREIGDEFGKTVPGIFTDEPNIYAPSVRSRRRSLPWTDGLDVYFAERRGHDLLDDLPWLFYAGDRAAQSRHDYWYTVSQRFTEAFSKQLGEWCERAGLAFTGHYLCENEMGLGILRGGALMPHYRYQHVPGIDMLTEQNHEFLAIKQCTSAAHQFARRWVLSETYGCSSWEFTFEGQKWVGDWQYVLGVNLRCQHLALYTLRGCRKRDYPPAFNYNTTWWKYNKVVEDYFARVGRVLTAGDPVRDVLVLHPVATGWSMLGEGAQSLAATDAYGERLNTFVQGLLAAHYDFDFGDEQIMADDARVEDDTLWVGQAPYKVVVIPPETRTLLSSTVDLLRRFLEAGGRIIAFDATPDQVEALPEPSLATDLWAHPGVTILPDRAGLQAALESAVSRRVSLRNSLAQEAGAVLYMQRRLEDGAMAYFLFNGDRHNGHDLELALEGSGRIEEWDALTGEVRGVAARERDDKLCFSARIGPAGSRLYIVDPQGAAETNAPADATESLRDLRGVRGASFVGPVCAFTRTDPNVLTLDMCRYRMGDGPWSEEMEVWRAQNEVRTTLDMRPNYYNGLPQRYKWALEPHAHDGKPVTLRFCFDVHHVPSTPVSLLVEGAAQFAISLNGSVVPNDVTGWYLDRSMHKVTLPTLLAGENVLDLVCAYTNHMELEDCFLLGDFGVSIDRAIIAEPDRLHFGDWTTQGYPHYAGSMIYHGRLVQQGGDHRRVFVHLGEHEAVHVAVHVNGALAGHIPWQDANDLEITAHLGVGVNNIDIEVVSSPRNMLGPLHLAPGREPWTDWRAFRRTDETYTPEYVLKSWGLIGQVHLRRR
jgi:hypothetical protein